MRHAYLIAGVIIIISIQFARADINCGFRFDDTYLQGNKIVSSIEAGYFAPAAGEPDMPFKMVSFLLPPEADLASVKAVVDEMKTQEINGIIDLAPVAPGFTSKGPAWPVNRSFKDGRDIAIYAMNGFFPTSIIKNIYTGKLRKYKVVDLYLSPWQYNPVKKALRKIISCKISVIFNSLTSVEDQYPESEDTKQRLAAIVANYSMEQRYQSSEKPRSESQKYNYVIMIPNSLKSSLTSFDKLVASKTAHGLSVKVTTEADWGGGSVESVRNWLKNNYQSMGIEYVLIIGSPTGVIPMQRVTTDYDDPLTDVVYQEISGTWDKNGDGLYGEFPADFGPGGVDRLMDLHLGRIPEYGNAQIVDNIINKIINYENEKEADIAWRKKAFFPMHIFSDAQNGYVYGKAIEDAIVTPNAGWSAHRVYDAPVFGCLDFPPSYSKVLENWNKFDYGIVVWQAHGQPTDADQIMNTSTAASLGQKKTGFVYQTSCNNAKPEDASNLAYAVLKSTAIATVAYSEECIYSAFNTNYGTGPNANDYGFLYAKNLVNSKMPAGKAINAVRDKFPSTSGSAWQNYACQQLYGCPDVGVYTTAGTTAINQNTVVPAGTLRIMAAMRGPGQVLFTLGSAAHQGGTITLYSAGGKQIRSIAVAQGCARLSLCPPSLAKGIYFAVVKLAVAGGRNVSYVCKLAVR